MLIPRNNLLSVIAALCFCFSAHGGVDKQLECVAEAVYFEARGEPVLGQLAVAQVIVQRVESRFYPDTPCKVVRQNHIPDVLHMCQFSYYCDGVEETIADKRAYQLATVVSKHMLAGNGKIPSVEKATMYAACKDIDDIIEAWKGHVAFLHKIGNHCFYYELRNQFVF